MTRPLHEVLRQHKKPEHKEPDKAAHVRHKDQKITDVKPLKHVLLTKSDARTLFLDLPKEHKFWLRDGREINNLTELYESLITMSEDAFRRHVNQDKNDFAKWIKESLHDTVLSRKLILSTSKVEHVELVRERIDELKYRGAPIPKPNTKLQPDYSFIKLDKKPMRVPEIEKSFRLAPKELVPDNSFINLPPERRDIHDRFDKIVNAQLAMMGQVHDGVKTSKQTNAEIGMLEAQFEAFSNQIKTLKEEVTGLKGQLAEKSKKDEVQAETYMNELKDSIAKLRHRERIILEQLKHTGAVEMQVMQKHENLAKKEQELTEKENLVLKREDEYGKLMKKYNEMLGNLNTRMQKDENKIEELLEVEQVPVVHDLLAKTEMRHETSAIPVPLPTEQSDEEIARALKKAKDDLQRRQFKDARKEIAHAAMHLKHGNYTKEFKKKAYFQIFELQSELDMREK
jgi:hypothetical protein